MYDAKVSFGCGLASGAFSGISDIHFTPFHEELCRPFRTCGYLAEGSPAQENIDIRSFLLLNLMMWESLMVALSGIEPASADYEPAALTC